MRSLRKLWGYVKSNPVFVALAVLSALIGGFHHLPEHGLEAHTLSEALVFALTLLAFFFLLPSDLWTSPAYLRAWKIGKFRKRLIRIKRGFHTFYIHNEIYSKLMILTLVWVLFGNIHFLQSGQEINDQIRNAVKVWELAAYITITSYHVWFWKWSPKGIEILDDLRVKAPLSVLVNIILVVVGLIVIALFHIVIILISSGLLKVVSNDIDWLKYLTSQLSIILIVAVYVSFIYIDISVITYVTKHKYRRDFIVGLKHVDRPIMIIFSFLFIYAICTSISGHFHDLEIFFSGAIAFDLLLSSIGWANTSTV